MRFGNNGPKRSFFFFNKYYISSVEIKNLNVIIDNKSLFEQPRKKNKQEAYQKLVEMWRNNDYTVGNLLDYLYHQKYSLEKKMLLNSLE